MLAADVDGLPLLLIRDWSGCHFCCALAEEALAPEALADEDRFTLALWFTLAFLFTLTLLFTFTLTSP